MATPNDSGPPKKPQTPPPAAKPPAAGQPPAQPRPQGQPAPAPKPQGGQVPAKPAAPAPASARPPAPGAPKPAAPPGQAPARPAAPTPAGAKTPPPAAQPPRPGIPVPPKPGAAPAAKAPQPGKPAADAGKPPAKPGAAPAANAPQPGKPAAAKTGEKPAAPGKKPPAEKKAPVPHKSAAARNTSGRKIGQVLIDLGFLDENILWELLDEAKSSGALLGQVAIARGLISEDQLMQGLAEQFGLKVVNLQEVKPSPEALQLLPETMASVYKVLPLSFKDSVLTVAVSDTASLGGLDDLRNLLSLNEVTAVLAPAKAMEEVLSKCYAGKEESIIDIIKMLEEEGGEVKKGGRESSIDLDNILEIQNEAPVRKLLNMVMLLAIKDRASDIHFEPFEEEYKIRMKADGVLVEMVPPPRHLANAIATRIKVMANLDIAERRLPQDGRIELNVGGNAVDLRVSLLPTMFGESAVIRVLDKSSCGLDLNRIGMPAVILDPFREMIKRPNGIVLVTGPTGSGKTTTLYSALNELNEVTEKIITTEDPVEYDIDGIVQVQINTDVGLTFGSALRAILRQDPDIILVGEIRDLETAQIAVQAALTGHLVFSTLHTNDAPSTVTRMRDMGLETYLITACVQGILAQRLVRKICEDCRTEFDPSDEMLMELQLTRKDVVGKKFYYGKGCDRCNNSGYKGRTGLHELLTMNDELRDMISAGASTDALREAARKQGMITLRDSGLRAIFNGISTIDEVVHETVLEDEA